MNLYPRPTSQPGSLGEIPQAEDGCQLAAADRFASVALSPKRRGYLGECPMIEAHGLSKRYGSTRAVEDLSFTVRPSAVTGFLGPDGSGKSTKPAGHVSAAGGYPR